MASSTGAPFISELMAANASTLADEDGDFPDWIEIANPDAAALDLEGYFLTDAAGTPGKWRIPEVSVPPGGFLLVFASDKDREVGELHTNFKLSAGGEYCALVAPDGTTVIDAFAPAFPALGQDISFGIDDTGAAVFFNLPTPGAANGVGSSRFVEPPVFSASSQLFVGSLALDIANPGGAGVVRYTTDGTVPTAASGALAGSLSITEPTTVKALVVIPGQGQSRVVTAHFAPIAADLQGFSSDLPITVLDADGPISNRADAGQPKHDLRVFVIPVDPLSGRANITAPAQVTTRAGADVRGNTSAAKVKKNYNVEFWKEPEEDRTHLVSGERLPRDREKKLLGMPSEADWVLYGLDLAHERSYFNNAFIYGLARDLGYPAPRTRFCELFINPGNAAVSLADYRGLYMWVEKIKAGKGRVDLQPFNSGETDPGLLGGYIVRINDVSAGDLSFRTRQPYNTPTYDGHSFSIYDPKAYDAGHPGNDTPENARQADRDRIREYLSDFESALFSAEFFDPAAGYAQFIEPRSFMMYQSLQELAANNDIYTASVYLQKDVGAKIEMGSLWDFDWAFTRAHYVSPGGSTPYIGWWYDAPNYVNFRDDCLVPWFLRLAEDPEYLSGWHDLWAELRRDLLADRAIDARLDGLATQLQEATVRDRAKFGGLAMPAQVSEMKSWTKGRAAWMDSQLGGQTPTFSLPAGIVPGGSALTLSPGAGQAGSVYYTLDGSDPRLPETPTTPGTPLTLLPRGSVWEFLDDGSDAGDAWRTASGGWSSGQAELGYGDGDENTVVARGPFGARYITTYFRRELVISAVGDFSGFVLRLRRDDGAVVYVNGTEVVRSNLPAAPAAIGYLTAASESVSGSEEGEFLEFPIGPGAFADGSNLIAVEVHQDGPASSDLSFDLELVGISGGSGGVGGPSPSAVTTPNPLALEGVVTVTARSFDGSQWSPLARATFIAGGEVAAADNLAIAEINYHPRAAEPAYGDEAVEAGGFEFIELANTGPRPIDLAGVAFSAGVEVLLPADAVLALEPGARAVLVDDRSAFRSRFGPAPVILGNYSGALSNAGEFLELRAADGSVIDAFAYSDTAPWPTRADGAGSSLERIGLSAPAANPGNWRASSEVDGTPGVAGAGADGRVVINEVFSNSPPPLTDSIEFFNTTAAPIDVGGWFVSDSADLRKYSFPAGTLIAAGEFLLLDESDFNPGNGAGANDFALDGDAGDEVWLVAADAAGKLLRFVDVVEVAPSPEGQTLGRVPDGAGELRLLTNASLGISNASSYEGWAHDTFPAGTPAADSAASADPEGDGLVNLLEFALALDPLAPDPQPLTLAWDGAGWRLSYPRRTPLAGSSLAIAVSPDLSSWQRPTPGLLTRDLEVIPLRPGAVRVTDRYEGTADRLFRLELKIGIQP